jgi:YD repeat-containing protein
VPYTFLNRRSRALAADIAQDANRITIQLSYRNGSDPLDRLSQVVRASVLGLQNQTAYSYPNLTTIITKQDQAAYNDQVIQSTSVTDGLGRAVQTQRVTPQGTIYAQTDLDALARARNVYNPVYGTPNSCTSSSANCTVYTYDAHGRLTNTTYSDGSQETFTWTGDTVVHKDPAGIQTQQQVDALGRTVQVIEVPSNTSDPN